MKSFSWFGNYQTRYLIYCLSKKDIDLFVKLQFQLQQSFK